MFNAILAVISGVLKIVEIIAPKIPFTPAEKRAQFRLNAERNYREWKRKLEKKRLDQLREDASRKL